MSSKFELITDIYKQISNEVVRSPYNWQSFLSSVCHNYRLRFDEQLLVYAQRPDATAVLETVRWNKRFYRWVNRGAKGIAVFSESCNLKYYFDISDTHESKNAKPVPVWQYKTEYEADVIETLENSFGELEDKSDIYNAVMSAAENVVEDNIPDYLSDLLMITKDSFLEELDDDMISSMYKTTVKNSMAYMLLSRLGLDADEYFSRDDFKDIVNFNTPDTLNSIGYATSDISETVLYEISKTVKSLEMENRIIAENDRSDYTKAVNKNIERSADYDRTHLQNGKRLSDTKYRYAKSEKFDLEQIWADEEEISQRESQSNLLQSDDIGQTEQSSVRSGQKSEGNGRNIDDADVRTGRIDREDESRKSDSLGAGNEQSETKSTGNRDERDSVQSVTEERPPFADEDLALGILKNTNDDLSVSKKDIAEYFKYHSDITDRANFVRQSYPDAYTELDVNNIRVGYKAEKEGLLLWKGAYLSRTEESFFSWNIVSEIIGQLIDSGENMGKENTEPLQFSIFDFSDSLPEIQSFETAQTTLFPAPELSQQIIDEALCLATHDDNSILDITAYFKKDKPIEKNAEFLKSIYKDFATGFISDGENISVWAGENGLKIARGNNAEYRSTATVFSWKDAAKRIRDLLDMGRYIPSSMLDKVGYHEKSELADRIIYMARDIEQEYQSEYMPLVLNVYKEFMAFPDVSDALVQKMNNPDDLSVLADELEKYANAVKINPGISRYPKLYNPFELLEKVKDLLLPQLEFEGQKDIPQTKRFISEDELKILLRGTNSDYRIWMYSLYQNEPDKKKREDAIKQHYGWSGSLDRNKRIESNGKGLTISHGNIFEPYAKARIKWSDVEKRVGEMIAKDIFLTQQNKEKLSEAKKEDKPEPLQIRSDLYRKYLETKTQYLDNIVLFQVGDFYNLYGNDALNTNNIKKGIVTDVTMDNGETVPIYSIIKSTAKEYIEKLIDSGFVVTVSDEDNEKRYDATYSPDNKEDFNKNFPENPIEKAKRIIKDYYDREFEDDKSVDFSDMSNVGLAFSETENGEHEITVSANLEHFSIDIFVDDKLYERRKYSSIDDLIDQELYSLNFQELTSLDEDRISQMFEIQSSESIEKPSTSPIWDEYRDIKKIYKDDIILYQVGDFFEVMGDDAKIVADKFDLVLTGRDVGYKDRIAMCGFPVRSKDKYIKGINELGYSVVVSSLNNGERQQGLYLSDNISDDFDDIDTNEIRAELEKSGIVNGKVVDADKLNNSPFIKQVVSDTEKAQQSSISDIEPEPQEDKPLTVPQSKPKSRVQTFDLHPEIPISDRHDYNFAEKEIETVGKKERFRRNMAAINVLKECEFENRFATPEEQEILSGYVGWGGIPEAFDENNEAWADEFIELYETLSPEEYKTAMDSVLTAFYTPQTVISAIYKVLDNLGFKQGNILEPSCAIGNFIGMLPDNMKGSKMYGVEIDSISAGIAQQLYQTSSVMTSPFEQAEMPDSFFDAVVGNVPFGDIKVTDKRYDKNKFLIHDYFFAKSLDKLRPGGIMCLVTSKGTMDKENSAVRKYIAQRADLLGAVRLPDNTFKGNAGTEVTSDILILQKRDRITDIEPEWVQLDTD